MNSKAEIEAFFAVTLEANCLRELKKAYAKKIKVHSPEKDPDMFQVVRQAYEAGVRIIERLAKGESSSVPIESEPRSNSEPVSDKEAHDRAQTERSTQAKVRIEDVLVDGFCRSLENDLADQAQSYLLEMKRESYHINLIKRTETIDRVLRFLCSPKMADHWQIGVVSAFLDAFRVQEEQYSDALRYITKRNWCEQYGWDDAEYERRGLSRQRAWNWWGQLANIHYEQSESAAIKFLNDLFSSPDVNSQEFLEEWFDVFLENLDRFFPRTLPRQLVRRIEVLLNGQLDLSTARFSHGRQHLDARISAYDELQKYRDAAEFKANTAYGIACRILLGMSSLNGEYASKKLHVFRYLKQLKNEVAQLSDWVHAYEIIGKGEWQALDRQYHDLMSFKSQDFKPSAEVTRDDTKTFFLFAKLIAIFSGMVFLGWIAVQLGWSPENMPKEKLKGFVYIDLGLITFLTIMAAFYGFRHYVSPALFYYRHALYISRARQIRFYRWAIPISIVTECILEWFFGIAGGITFVAIIFAPLSVYLRPFNAILLLSVSAIVAFIGLNLVRTAFAMEGVIPVLMLTVWAWLIYLLSKPFRLKFAQWLKSGLMPAYAAWIILSIALSMGMGMITSAIK